MIHTLRLIYQLVSWGCIVLAWTNGAILLWDGCTNEQSRVITFAVALLFGVIGGIVLGVERSLSRIYRCSTKASKELLDSAPASSWTLLYVCLIAGVFLFALVMGSGLFAIIGRLQQGFHIFG